MRFLPLILLLTVFGCNRNLVRLEYTNAKDEVPQLGNLVFRFSNALAADSVLNEWDSTAYVRFKPAIEGRFRWEQPDQLVFSPSRPLPPATSFSAELSDEILASSAFNGVRSQKISFYTAQLKLEDINVNWTSAGGNKSDAFPRLDIYFNYNVDPNTLKDKLKIEAEGKQVPYRLITASGESRISIGLQGFTPADKTIEGKIVVDKGLVPQGGTNGLQQEITAPFSIPSPFNLVINNLTSQHDGVTGIVNVSTSQQLESANINSLINFEPSIKFSVETTDEGFQIKSDQFNADLSYQVTIQKGLRGNVGGVLQEEYINGVAFGELEPYVSFTNTKGVYLSALGNRMIEARIVNVPKVKVIISKIYESNLLAARTYGYEPRETNRRNDDDYYSDYYDSYYASAISMGDVVFEKEIETISLPKSGNSRLFQFNIDDRLAGLKGIYHIRIQSSKNYWMRDSRFIAVSDIGLIAKEGTDKLFVFANSIRNAEPKSGVNVVAYGNNNQVIGTGTTNADGVAEVAYTRKEFAGFKPAMIVAKTEEDFNYLPFGGTLVNMSRFETGGKRLNTAAMDAYIYGERDIYRPGERINFSVIVRDKLWRVPGQLPLRFRLLYPNGKEFRTFRKTLNEQGSAEAQIDIPQSAITGTYTLEAYTTTDVLIATSNFNVEEFVPDRIRLTAKINKKILSPGDKASIDLNAVNFFGPPAAGRNYELEIQVKQKDFRPKKFAKYDFNIRNKGISLDNVLRQGTLNSEGEAKEQYEVPALFRNNGVLQVDIFSTVFDETGRPVNRKVSADVFTQPVFFGLGRDDYWYYALNQPIKFPIIGLDRNENGVNGTKAQVVVIKHEYRTVLTKSGDYFRYQSQASDKVVSEQTITVSGESTNFQFVPRSPGIYEIRVSVPGTASYVSRDFYSYGNWGAAYNAFEVDTDGNIDIETDKSIYQSGEQAKILFKTPFNGRLLVTIEQDRVLSYRYVDVSNRSASIDLSLNQEHLPNIFVTATLIKPHGVSEMPLTVAHGFQNIRVEEKRRKNNVEIIAAKNARSNTVQEITVKAAPNSFVTLAAVDNGVLQVSDFTTPDPYKYFYSSRALQVTAYDIYPLLFPELRARLSSTGGDAEMSMQKRVNPMPAKRIQIVSHWSGIVKTNGNGQAKIKFNVPKFSGEVRLMAVAYRDEMFGFAESTMTIADPIVISTGLPRFLSPGDSLSVPVTITNTTAKPVTATARIQVGGKLTIAGNAQTSISLQSKAESRPVFGVVAGNSIDTARINVEVQAGNEKYTEIIPIGIRPTSPLIKQSAAGSIPAGKSIKPSVAAMNFLPGTSEYKLVVSRSPAMELAEQLQYLVRYPFGCTEQIVSAAFPQLYYGDLASQLKNRKVSAENANQNVLEAMRQIRMRQLYNGALLLWDGDGQENWWTTAYAAHFLIEAKKAGFEIDESLLNTMLGYLNNRLRNRNTISYYYNRDQVRKIAPKEVPYSLYVLALASRANIAAMNFYKTNSSLLALDGKYLLASAYAAIGDKKKFLEVLPAAFEGEVSVPQTGGSFYSPIRDEAIALNALLDMDPDNKQIPIMARHVVNQLKGRRWYSTQECSFSFLAIGKLARKADNSQATAEVKRNGKVVANFSGKDLTYSSEGIPGDVEISVKGNGQLFYYLVAEGIGADGQYREEDNYIRVRKRFFDRNGNPLNENTFKVNDLVVVQITLENMFKTSVENIVITDMLPAGFEIENPRTREIPGMYWIRDASAPRHLDARDDRMNLFVDLYSGRQVYYYAVRAVTPGVFKMGPVAADAMYNGEYHSYHGAGTVRIME